MSAVLLPEVPAAISVTAFSVAADAVMELPAQMANIVTVSASIMHREMSFFAVAFIAGYTFPIFVSLIILQVATEIKHTRTIFVLNMAKK